LPTGRLAFERSVSFANPGWTLGVNRRRVEVQTRKGTVAFPEHVQWKQAGVTFATFNVPGSNNNTVPWGAPWNTDAVG
jgi:hypothetical protein